jgi:hypothetical protein
LAGSILDTFGSTMSSSDDFQALAASIQGFAGTVLAFDPGETTGWAVFNSHKLIKAGQLSTSNPRAAYDEGKGLIERVVKFSEGIDKDVAECPEKRGEQLPRPTVFRPINGACHIVIEDYRVYAHKAESHKYSSVFTVKVVGILEVLASLNNIPYSMCMAQLAKGFITDAKLQAWGFWQTGERHARDAVRHGAYYIVRAADQQKRPTHNFDK